MWLVYDEIRFLCGSENNSSLVAPSIQSNRAARMVLAPWEVRSRSSQSPGRPIEKSSSRWERINKQLIKVMGETVETKQKVKQMLLLHAE